MFPELLFNCEVKKLSNTFRNAPSTFQPLLGFSTKLKCSCKSSAYLIVCELVGRCCNYFSCSNTEKKAAINKEVYLLQKLQTVF